MALSIIVKVQKKIIWKGLPTSSDPRRDSDEQIQKTILKDNIMRKKEYLENLKYEQQTLDSLVKRNESFQYQNTPESSKLSLPFIVINTDKKTVIDCEINSKE
jgi:hypothetical protein